MRVQQLLDHVNYHELLESLMRGSAMHARHDCKSVCCVDDHFL